MRTAGAFADGGGESIEGRSGPGGHGFDGAAIGEVSDVAREAECPGTRGASSGLPRSNARSTVIPSTSRTSAASGSRCDAWSSCAKRKFGTRTSSVRRGPFGPGPSAFAFELPRIFSNWTLCLRAASRTRSHCAWIAPSDNVDGAPAGVAAATGGASTTATAACAACAACATGETGGTGAGGALFRVNSAG